MKMLCGNRLQETVEVYKMYPVEYTPVSVIAEQVKSKPSIQELVKTMYKLVKNLYTKRK